MIRKSYLLATDLDNTLVGDPEALKHLFTFYKEKEFDPGLIYVTGRHLNSALSLIQQEKLPSPDILITDVGTAIYHAPDWSEDKTWATWVNETWLPEDVLSIFKNTPALVRQKLPHQKRISFTVRSRQSNIVQAIQAKLYAHNIPCHLVYSSGCDLDILPERSGKGKAVEYVLQKYAKNDVKILLAGDSGNDADMLTLGYPAVIVGNAQEELSKLPSHTLLYRAVEYYAAGIKEAWDHFYPAAQQ
ncbi:HAD-IIB family hydrolase [Sporosarcina sp. P33]|uniref:HAD-IIB family hydrolase n=1 Tax=Sporosarcina sp. P33 TaxID=1930764 RepID=UPI0009BFBA0F|nr:HAD-IIB family hydrolase [Sporosarcina sp. P33]